MKILLTGGTGSLGSALAAELHAEGHELTIISRDDHKQAAQRVALPGAAFHSIDVGNLGRFQDLVGVCEGRDACVHAAAQKVVGEGQYQPFAYINTNILGTMSLLQAWRRTHGDCRQFLFISSDKAVAPLNTYGATKMVAGSAVRFEDYDGSVLRYGNVVTSRGSFVETWKKAKAEGDPLTVRVGATWEGELTGETPTRFFLTMADAVSLVREALGLMARGEAGIFVPCPLPAFDLADVAGATGLEVRHEPVGAGEKLHESLLADGEGWKKLTGGGRLGRVMIPHWPADRAYYYGPFRSDTARKMAGAEVLEKAGWYVD